MAIGDADYWRLQKNSNKLERCDSMSPLVLDLDGDGVEADALTYFDHEGDGSRKMRYYFCFRVQFAERMV